MAWWRHSVSQVVCEQMCLLWKRPWVQTGFHKTFFFPNIHCCNTHLLYKQKKTHIYDVILNVFLCFNNKTTCCCLTWSFYSLPHKPPSSATIFLVLTYITPLYMFKRRPSALCKKQEMHHVRRGLKNCFMVTVKAKNQSLRLKPGYKWADSFPKKMPHAKKYIPSSHRIYFLYSLLPSLSRESLSHIKSPILLHLLCQVSPFLLLYRLGQIPPLSFPFLYLFCLCVFPLFFFNFFYTFSPLRVQSIFFHASCSYITRLRAQFQSHN